MEGRDGREGGRKSGREGERKGGGKEKVEGKVEGGGGREGLVTQRKSIYERIM